MKKLIAVAMAAALLCISQTGCSGDAVVKEVASQVANAAQSEVKKQDSEEAKKQDSPEVEKQDSAESAFTFADLSNYSFSFSSGAGSWATVLEINADGSFAGSYSDFDMGSTGPGYPNGGAIICNFQGRFTQLKKVNEYTYSMKMEGLSYENAKGSEKIENGIKYIYTEAYGVEGGDEFLVYLPGAPVSKLSEEFIIWVQYDISGASELSSYALCNVARQYGFWGYIKEDLGGKQYVSQNNVIQHDNAQYSNTGANTYDYSYTKYGGGYTQKYVGDFYQSDESGSGYINMYSSRDGDEIGNIEINCEWLGSYKGTIHDYGKPDNYFVISTSGGPDVYLEFLYDGATPYFKLKQEPPKAAINADESMVIGIFYLTEPWQYH